MSRHGTDFFIDRPRGAGSAAFVLFHTPILLRLGRKEAWMEAGTWVLFGARSAYRYANPREGFDNSWFHLPGDESRRLSGRFGLREDRPGLLRTPAGAAAILEELQWEFERRLPRAREGMRLQCEQLFLHLSRQAEGDLTPPPARGVDPHLRVARTEIHRRLDHRWTVAETAALAHHSPSRFAAVYRQAFGVPPLEDLLRAPGQGALAPGQLADAGQGGRPRVRLRRSLLLLPPRPPSSRPHAAGPARALTLPFASLTAARPLPFA